MVFQEMRPPVAAINGETPLRGKHVNKLIEMANAEADASGFRVSKEQIIKNYTDDARLQDLAWNNRHHVTPSNFNTKNHTQYKLYFDKDFKGKQGVMLHPQRQLDPFEENDVKGTRMPDYTKLSKERDIYGELGWISNFNVKSSKNNGRMHSTFREYFDSPKNYHKQFNNASLTNQEFFRQNAPQGSVARLPLNGGGNSPRNNNSTIGFKSYRSNAHKRSTTIDPDKNFQGSSYATPFLLEKDRSNRHQVMEDVKRTVGQSTEIPFLRTQLDPMKLSKTHHGTFMGQYIEPSGTHGSFQTQEERMRAIKMRRLARKEQGWDNQIKPISKFNAKVHPSQRIPFEQI